MANAQGEQVVALVAEIETDARIAAKSIVTAEIPMWLQIGGAPLMARAAWSDAQEMAQQAEALGHRVDIERVFRSAMGVRAFNVLMEAVRGGRRG